MYSVVLAMALTTSADMTEFRRCGCHCGCGCYCGCRCGCGCFCGCAADCGCGCYGGCYCGCYSGCYCGSATAAAVVTAAAMDATVATGAPVAIAATVLRLRRRLSGSLWQRLRRRLSRSATATLLQLHLQYKVAASGAACRQARLDPANDAEREAVRLVLAELRRSRSRRPLRSQVTVSCPPKLVCSSTIPFVR